MKNIFFFDLDGTVWDNRCIIPDSTREAILKLHENGQFIFVCTGRTRAFLNVPDLHDLPFDGAVYGCGTHIEYAGKTLYCSMLDTKRVKRIVDCCNRYHVHPILEGPEYMYIDSFLNHTRYIQESMNQYFHNAESASSDADSIMIQKATCVHSEESDWEKFNEDLSSDFTVIKRSMLSEIVPFGYSKAEGIKYVLNLLNLDSSDSYAFGDSENDLPMLRYVGHGIAMGNSPESVKQSADMVTDDINKDGIYNALKKMNFI